MKVLIVKISVADPDPNSESGSVGSISFCASRIRIHGSISQRYGSGFFYHKAKIVRIKRKTFIPIVL
jgi:hypothetical protein